MKTLNNFEELKKSGIYAIKNSINAKIYVGSAVSFRRRMAVHKHAFNKNKHNQRFQNFINKYGIETLEFQILEFVLVNDLIKREQYWINYFQSYKSKNGYNISKIAGSITGVKMPESHRKASRERMLKNKYRVNRKWTEEEKREIGIRSKKMWAENPEKRKKMGIKISKLKKGVPIWGDKNHPMLGKTHPAIKTIAIYNDGIKIDVVKGIVQIAKKYGLDQAAVSKVCNKKSKTTKGYWLEYVKQFKPSSKICSCGEINHKLKLSDREWTCEKCKRTHDRDILASQNIVRFAFSPSGRRDEPVELPTKVGAVKQEVN